MLGVLLLIVLSSVIAFLMYGKQWDVLGILPSRKRMLYFFISILLVAVLCFSTIWIDSAIRLIRWEIKMPVDFFLLGAAARYYFIAALTEELVFRGFLLYVLTKAVNAKTARIFSALCFGFYHWFSYEMFGAGIVPMMYIFIITGLAGYVWAGAFIKSGTIWLALGMHFSWNLTQSLFKGKEPYGSLLYYQISKTELSDLSNLFLSLFTGIVPSIAMYLALHYYLNVKKVQ
jgi:membrane protease YdiL (CAAX protease family)